MEERLEGYSVGGNDYIVKPCDTNELLEELRVLTQQIEKEKNVAELL